MHPQKVLVRIYSCVCIRLPTFPVIKNATFLKARMESSRNQVVEDSYYFRLPLQQISSETGG